MRFLKTNTATRVTVGPFFDVTDGVTPEISLTVTGCHLTMVVDNAGVPTLALDADATASGGDNDMVHVTNDDAGFYDLEFTAAQTNYLGRALLAIIDTDVHLPVFHEFMIVPAWLYNLFDGTSDIADQVNDEVVEGTVTLRQAIKLVLSVLTGISSGGGTATLTFRDIGNTKDRLSVTVDSNGNRTAVGTRDGS